MARVARSSAQTRCAVRCARTCALQEHAMMDVVMLAIAFGLFAVSVGYTIACDRL